MRIESGMTTNDNRFQGAHFPKSVILYAVLEGYTPGQAYFNAPTSMMVAASSEVLGFGGPGRLLKSSGSFDLPIMAQG